MPIFHKSSTAKEDVVPEVQWIPYRENGEVKYVRADSDEAKDFTATGGATKHVKPSAYANMPSGVGYMANNPQLLPERYTDESLLPVVVTNVVPSMKQPLEEKKTFMSKFKKDKEPSNTKVVWMPRGDYKKHFAKDKQGKYIGTEPQREWTEEELEDEFGQYHKDL